VHIDDRDGRIGSAAGRPVSRSSPRARRPETTASEFDQLELSVPVRGLQERDVGPDAIEPHDAAHRAALDRPRALQLESELDEEPGCGREVVNHDADVVQPLDRRLLDGTAATLASSATLTMNAILISLLHA
jgi:hypothetical protein